MIEDLQLKVYDVIFQYVSQNYELLALERALERDEDATILENNIIDFINVARNNIEQSLVRNNSQDLDNLLENEVNNIVPKIIDLYFQC